MIISILQITTNSFASTTKTSFWCLGKECVTWSQRANKYTYIFLIYSDQIANKCELELIYYIIFFLTTKNK